MCCKQLLNWRQNTLVCVFFFIMFCWKRSAYELTCWNNLHKVFVIVIFSLNVEVLICFSCLLGWIVIVYFSSFFIFYVIWHSLLFVCKEVPIQLSRFCRLVFYLLAIISFKGFLSVLIAFNPNKAELLMVDFFGENPNKAGLVAVVFVFAGGVNLTCPSFIFQEELI